MKQTLCAWPLWAAIAGLASGAEWVAAAHQPEARSGHAMAFDDRRGVTILLGGQAGGEDLTNPTTWELDATGWRPAAALPAALRQRTGLAMAFDSSRGIAVLFGGRSISRKNDTWEYDGTAWTQRPAAPAGLTPRERHAMVFDASRGAIVLFGGSSAAGNMNDTWLYTASGWSQGPTAPLTMPKREWHAMAYDSRRSRVVLFGGYDFNYLRDMWELDAAGWSEVTTVPPGLLARGLHAMTYDGSRGVTIIFGGDSSGALHDTWEYDGTTITQGPIAPPSMQGRSAAELVFDSVTQRAVLFGGNTGRGEPSDTWLYDGLAWLPAATLQPRYSLAAAWDDARAKLVIHGGIMYGGQLLDDTWELSAGVWTRGAPSPPALTARYGHVMAYQPSRNRIVLFGGSDGALRSDCWEYDGTSWTPGAPAPPALTPRRELAMVLDRTSGRLVLFGGWDGSYRNDTWELDATGWSPGALAPPGLVGRAAHAMACDTRRGRIVLVGGYGAGTYLRDVWEYDGSAWTAGAAPPALFVAREGHAMSDDPRFGAIVVHSGRGSSGQPLGDLWLYDGTSWYSRTTLPANIPVDHHALLWDPADQATLVCGVAPDAWFLDRTGSVVTGPGPEPTYAAVAVAVDPDGTPSAEFVAYAGATHGLEVGGGDIDGIAPDEILTGPGPGGALGPEVRAFRPGGSPLSKVDFYAYGVLRYGVRVDGGAIDSEPHHEIVTGPGPGSVFGPHVRAFSFDGTSVSTVSKVSYYAYGTLRYGVGISGGDLDADGFEEILTAPGPGAIFGPHVRGWNYDGIAVSPLASVSFFAFGSGRYGAEVAGGDVDADGVAEIVCAPGPDPTAFYAVQGFDYAGTISPLPGFTIQSSTLLYGAHPAVGDLVGSSRADLALGQGPGAFNRSSFQYIAYDGQSVSQIWSDADPYGLVYGVNVAVAQLGR